MKKGIVIFVIGVVCTFSFASSVSATLIDRGSGMIFDDDLNVTWLADANYAQTSGYDADGLMNWSSANAWADSLVFGGFDDWRLPATLQPDPSCNGQSGGVSWGYNCTGSEMGHLFYDELGGTAGSSILTVNNGSAGFDLFSNLQNYVYWSGTEYAPVTNLAWYFYFNLGGQDAVYKSDVLYALAVRSGDVSAVPEPGTLLLLGVGLAGLTVYRKKTGQIDRGDLVI